MISSRGLQNADLAVRHQAEDNLDCLIKGLLFCSQHSRRRHHRPKRPPHRLDWAASWCIEHLGKEQLLPSCSHTAQAESDKENLMAGVRLHHHDMGCKGASPSGSSLMIACSMLHESLQMSLSGCTKHCSAWSVRRSSHTYFRNDPKSSSKPFVCPLDLLLSLSECPGQCGDGIYSASG